MKVLLLGDPGSSHLIKWANGIHSKGADVLIFGLSDFDKSQYNHGIKIEIFKIPNAIKLRTDGSIFKSVYMLCLPRLKSIIKKYKCDILHSHSASSYGLIGALSMFHPHITTVWGKDVYNFPNKNFLFKKILMFNLNSTDAITSSSITMAKYIERFTEKEVLITPFGIKLDEFKPMEKSNLIYNENDIVIGTVKAMEKDYGSEDILNAFNILKKKYPSLPIKLLLVGRGSLINRLNAMATEYDINDSVSLTGPVPYDQVPLYHNMLDIYLAPSINESFGVGVLEASACGKPVIVSNIGGLPEVVIDNQTGYMVPPNNPKVLAEKIEVLMLNKALRLKFGLNGRNFVETKYDFDKILDYMINIYEKVLKL